MSTTVAISIIQLRDTFKRECVRMAGRVGAIYHSRWELEIEGHV